MLADIVCKNIPGRIAREKFLFEIISLKAVIMVPVEVLSFLWTDTGGKSSRVTINADSRKQIIIV